MSLLVIEPRRTGAVLNGARSVASMIPWILCLGLVPVETAVRAALYGQDFVEQVRTGPPWWLYALILSFVAERVRSALVREPEALLRRGVAGLEPQRGLERVPGLLTVPGLQVGPAQRVPHVGDARRVADGVARRLHGGA